MKDSEFKIKEVRGLSTILEMEPFPDDLLSGLKTYNKIKNHHYERAVEGHFKELFKCFFTDYGLKYPKENYVLWLPDKDRNYFSIEFEKQIIIPSEIREGDGYEPRAEVRMNKKQNEVDLQLFLGFESRMINMVGELMGIKNLKGDGVKKPTIDIKNIKETNRTQIYISGIQWFEPFIEEAKRFYEILGEEKLRELCHLEYEIERNKGEGVVKRILSDAYKSKIESLSLPTKNF